MLAITAFAVALAVTLASGPVCIPILRKLKFGQSIREIGPSWHAKKSGTPTMGGIMFIIGIVAAVMVVANRYVAEPKITLLLFIAIGFGAIGFVDDYIKVVKKRNLGLTSAQKFSLQFAVSLVFTVVLLEFGYLDSYVPVPYIGEVLNLGWFFIPFTVFVILGVVNSVNLTDGLDGLASSVTFVVAVFFAAAAQKINDSASFVLAFALCGGCLGFLFYNKYPAKVFMGDTGSLFLGGMVAGMAVVMDIQLLLIIAGGIYMIETLSVILQVISFKLTKKRIFKMSPLHHHFEMLGWKEVKIALVFTLISAVLAVVAYFGL